MKRRYLSLTPYNEAIRIMKEVFPPIGMTERVPIEHATGRVTAEPIYAPYSVPEVNLAAMDGITVRSEETKGAADQNPITLENLYQVNTGQVIPEGYDAVIMIEDVWREDTRCTIRKSAFPGQFIRPAGEDIRQGELILPPNHVVRPFDIGALATYGITNLLAVSVHIGLIPIGDELVPAGAKPKPGSAVESNTLFASEYFSGMGATCHRYPITRDEPDMITEALYRAVQDNEMVVLFGGSSAGTKDWLEWVISSCGNLLFHGVGMKPGTPMLLGSLEDKPVFGVPGFPIAAACVIREFASRLLEWWGLAPYPLFSTRARLAQRIHSDLGYEEFIQISAARVDDRICVMPHSRGNGVQMSLVRSNGFIRIPSSHEGIEAGEEIQIGITCPPSQVDSTLLVCGVRDECIHLLGDLLSSKGYHLHCCNTMVAGALQILQMKNCHAASVTLPRTDNWQGTDFLGRIAGRDFVRVTVAEAELGLVSRDGLAMEDLDSARFINRPPGIPARILVDMLLDQNNIQAVTISGYENQARSEDNVITAIRNGSADAGICRKRTADKTGLSWLPLGYESYELVFPLTAMEDSTTAEILSILKYPQYRESIGRLGGYSTARTGSVTPISSFWRDSESSRDTGEV
jgi:putative molybdopterin biosynthesis protein